MNRKRFLELADFIESHAKNFNFGQLLVNQTSDKTPNAQDLKRNCGTMGCIAGFACCLAGKRKLETYDVEDDAESWLGISGDGENLFYIGGKEGNSSVWLNYAGEYGIPECPTYENIDAEIAANVLREIAAGNISL